MDNYDQILFAPSDVAMALARRMKQLRRRKNITQHQLAARSNVSYSSLCKFERTGVISLESFIKLTMELGVVDEVRELFTRPGYSTIDEVISDRR